MGQILHGCATTTEADRRAIQNSQESLRGLAKRYGINQKTVAKWKQRETVTDRSTGPAEAKSTVLSIEEEAIIVAFRQHTLLPLDDCLYALQPTIPHLTRSSLHRCLQRHGISRLPEVGSGKPSKKKFKAYPIGYFHIDIAEFQTAEGKLYLYVAIDRTSKFTFAQLARKTGRTSAAAFLEALIAAVPYKIHTVLTDNGIQFTFPPRYADGPTARYATHMFDMRCRENGIEHRPTKIKHPWTNGQVERMNRTIKEATVQRYYYDRLDQLEAHLADFINAYNYARRLKTLKGLTPYEYICKCWTSQPERFKLNPLQQLTRLNTFCNGPLMSSLPSKRHAAELMLLSVVNTWPPHHAVRGSGERDTRGSSDDGHWLHRNENPGDGTRALSFSSSPVAFLISSTSSMPRSAPLRSIGKLCRRPDPMQDHCQLTCQSDFCALRTSLLGDVHPPALEF